MNATSEVEYTLLEWRDMVRHSSQAGGGGGVRILGDLVEGTAATAAMAAIPGLAVYLSVDGSPWVHRLQPIEWGGW